MSDKPGQDAVQRWLLHPQQRLRFPGSCKARWAFHADVLRIAAASVVDSPGADGLGTACRGFAERTASKVGRWDSTRLWMDL